MTKSDRKKLRILIPLLAALGVTLFIGFRMNRRPNPEVVQAKAPKPEPVVTSQGDARIRLDLLEKQNADQDLGRKNLFQYKPKPVPPPPSTPAAPTQTFVNPTPQPPTPAPPPPPPQIPLKYIGYAYVEPHSNALIATLIDDQQRNFIAVEGDVYLGRYRVLRITASTVDVEDLEFNRRQTLPLIKQSQ
jgi:hypothetical protein